MPAFQRIATALDKTPASTPPFRSPILNGVVEALPRIRAPVQDVSGRVDLAMLKEGRKDKMWKDVESSAPEVDSLSVVRGLGSRS